MQPFVVGRVNDHAPWQVYHYRRPVVDLTLAGTVAQTYPGLAEIAGQYASQSQARAEARALNSARSLAPPGQTA